MRKNVRRPDPVWPRENLATRRRPTGEIPLLIFGITEDTAIQHTNMADGFFWNEAHARAPWSPWYAWEKAWKSLESVACVCADGEEAETGEETIGGHVE